jgi:hypothetical protein
MSKLEGFSLRWINLENITYKPRIIMVLGHKFLKIKCILENECLFSMLLSDKPYLVYESIDFTFE